MKCSFIFLLVLIVTIFLASYSFADDQNSVLEGMISIRAGYTKSNEIGEHILQDPDEKKKPVNFITFGASLSFPYPRFKNINFQIGLHFLEKGSDYSYKVEYGPRRERKTGTYEYGEGYFYAAIPFLVNFKLFKNSSFNPGIFSGLALNIPTSAYSYTEQPDDSYLLGYEYESRDIPGRMGFSFIYGADLVITFNNRAILIDVRKDKSLGRFNKDIDAKHETLLITAGYGFIIGQVAPKPVIIE
ncbi:MAG: hypothetical protein HQ568_02985 [Calditrichaeota bacterium]|nr:hypothetical protein [Calditrichota bacterium]